MMMRRDNLVIRHDNPHLASEGVWCMALGQFHSESEAYTPGMLLDFNVVVTDPVPETNL